MSVRGRHFLSRMLITFDPRGGSSRGMMQYLQKSGQQLKEKVESLGGQLFVEVRPSHHPEIRVCYVNGMHLNEVAKEEHKRFLRRTSELRWRPDTTNRIRNRRRTFRMTETPPFVTRNPDEERQEFRTRLVASDTAAGRARNAAELSHELPPDRPDENYSVWSLLTHRGSLKYDPRQMTAYETKNQNRGYRWPAWKVWGPSGKQLIARNLSPKEIKNHVWWLTRTTGQRSTKWGNNVERHRPARPSIQGKWDPTTAARLKHEAGSFAIRELAWEEVPEASDPEVCEFEALTAAPFIERVSMLPPAAAATAASAALAAHRQQPPAAAAARPPGGGDPAGGATDSMLREAVGVSGAEAEAQPSSGVDKGSREEAGGQGAPQLGVSEAGGGKK